MTENISLDEELQALSSLDKSFNISIEQLSNNNINVTIEIDKSALTQKYIELKENIKFLLCLKKNHPKSKPNLYCLSKFCYPELCDPRDLLEDLLEEPWGKDKRYHRLKNIIKNLPQFILDYIEDIQTQHFYIGKYYLDSIYDNKLLNLFPNLFFDNVYEKVHLETSNTYNDEYRKLLISEGFFLLFVEKSMFEREKLRLIFFAAIKSLIHIKHFTASDIVEFTWKIRGGKNILMRIRARDADKIVEIVMDILKKKSIKYKVTNKDYGTKEGELPQIQIDHVEEEINKYEVTLRLQENVNRKNVSYLKGLYEQAVEYYSAVNDNKYEYYTGKIKDMLANDEFVKLLNEKKKRTKDKDIEKKNSKKNNVTKKEEEKKIENKNIEEKKVEKKESENNKNENLNIKEDNKNKEKEGKNENKKGVKEEIKKEEKSTEVKKVDNKKEKNDKQFSVQGKANLNFDFEDDDDDE